MHMRIRMRSMQTGPRAVPTLTAGTPYTARVYEYDIKYTSHPLALKIARPSRVRRGRQVLADAAPLGGWGRCHVGVLVPATHPILTSSTSCYVRGLDSTGRAPGLCQKLEGKEGCGASAASVDGPFICTS